MTQQPPRKRNWYAGLTLEQRALANEILAEHIRAYHDERARDAFGKPGSLWAIGADGKAVCRVPRAQDIARALPHGYLRTARQ